MTVRRILMISSLWPPVVLGGAESYASALAEQLRARGGEVGVLTFGVGGDDVVSTVSPWPYRLEAYASKGAASRSAFHLLDVYRPAAPRAIHEAIDAFGWSDEQTGATGRSDREELWKSIAAS